jgi:stress response protein YsnF
MSHAHQEIYKKVYGKEISKEEAYEQGIKLVNFIKPILKLKSERLKISK